MRIYVDDISESPAINIIHLLRRRGALISFSDPHVLNIQIDSEQLVAQDVDDALSEADCAVIITDHSDFDYPAIVRGSRLIVDTRNALRGMTAGNIITALIASNRWGKPSP